MKLTLAILVLIWFVSAVINLIVLTIFTHKNIEALEEHMSDCLIVINFKDFWGDSVKGRHRRLSMIFGAMYMPGIMFRRGYITENAHLNIPVHLRRRIWALVIWLTVNFIFLTGLACAIKIYRS
jgi:hypothetical protein